MSQQERVLPEAPGRWLARDGAGGVVAHEVFRVEFAGRLPALWVLNPDMTVDSLHIFDWVGRSGRAVPA